MSRVHKLRQVPESEHEEEASVQSEGVLGYT